jgi:hypothetical protein
MIPLKNLYFTEKAIKDSLNAIKHDMETALTDAGHNFVRVPSESIPSL